MKLKPEMFQLAEPRSTEDLAKDKEFWDNNPMIWRCYSCGKTSEETGFRTESTWTDYGYEYDCVCNNCDSDYTFPDGEGEPQCECGHYGWWCDKCDKFLCRECWEWTSCEIDEEPLDDICKECN